MSELNDGGKAFPGIRIKQEGDPVYNAPTKYYTSGMSLRDYFAAKAMQGMLSDCGLDYTPDRLAISSYKIADAMIKAREDSHDTNI